MRIMERDNRSVKQGITLLLVAILYACTANAQQYTKWVAPPDADKMINPLEGNKEVLNNAHIIYNKLCSPCHGYKGKGDGPVAFVLNPKPADHTSVQVQSETDGAIFWKLTTGRGQMESYGTKLTEQQRWSIVNYIRTLKN